MAIVIVMFFVTVVIRVIVMIVMVTIVVVLVTVVIVIVIIEYKGWSCSNTRGPSKSQQHTQNCNDKNSKVFIQRRTTTGTLRWQRQQR